MSLSASLLDGLLARLLWTSAQACLLIGAVALACRLLPRLPAAVRCMLWWLVGAQLLLGLAWHSPLQLRWLPASTDAPVVVTRTPPVVMLPMATHTAPLMTVSTLDRPTQKAPFPWMTLLLVAWLAGVALQMARVVRQHWRVARARIGAEPAPPAWQGACRALAGRLGLRRAPRLALSSTIGSPQVIGAWRPLVLFPANARLSDEETAMAIAHELAHLRRGDLWLGWIPALAQRLFFFHPLVAWAMREYALSREAACDAQALAATGGAPQAYGRLLLRLGVATPLPSGLAGASPTFHNLKRRLTMLQHIEATSHRSRGWLLLVAIAVAGVVPYRVTAGSADTPPTSAAVQHVQPAASPAPAAPTAPAFAPPPPPLPPPAPNAPPAPPPPPPPSLDLAAVDGLFAKHVYVDRREQQEGSFALLDDESIIVTAPEADMPAIKRLREAADGPLLWFRHSGKAYVTRDAELVASALRAYAPVQALAREQGKLAGKQGKLAGKQAGLAYRSAGFAREQAALARQQAALARESALAQTASGPDEANSKARQAQERELERQQAKLEQQQAKLEQKHAALQEALAAQQQELQAQRAAFEKEQRELAHREQEASRQAEQQMQQVLQEAIRTGKAQPVRG